MFQERETGIEPYAEKWLKAYKERRFGHPTKKILTSFLTKDFEGQVPTMTGLDLAPALCYADVNVITYPSKTVSGTTAAITTVLPKTGGEDATDGLLLLMGTISAMIAITAKVYEFRRRKEEE